MGYQSFRGPVGAYPSRQGLGTGELGQRFTFGDGSDHFVLEKKLCFSFGFENMLEKTKIRIQNPKNTINFLQIPKPY